MLTQKRFLQTLVGTADQKSFKIIDPRGTKDSIREIDVSVMQGDQEPEGAAPKDWVVQVNYSSSPDIVLFLKNFTDEKPARAVAEDFSRLAAEIEGLIRNERFDEAFEKSGELEKKFLANSNQPPVETQGE